MTKTDIQKIQYKLGLTPDGVIGEKTTKAILNWQESQKLKADGIVGPISWYRMFGSTVDSFTPIGVVVHSMSEYFDWEGKVIPASELLDNLNLSIHCLIHPEGVIEYHTLPNKKALHAGKSQYKGLEDLNLFFLGIELLVEGKNSYGEFIDKIDQKDCYTREQIKAASDLLSGWSKIYYLSKDDIVRHSDISGDGIRGKGKGKKDPGLGLDWEEFLNLI